jgi:putative endonuclease
LGDLGEAAALKYLEKAGYDIVETNFRTRTGEIDIVAKDGESYAFIEVKTRTGQAFGRGVDSIDAVKQGRIVKVAEEWLYERGPGEVPVRFDVVEITRSGRGGLKVELIKDAFRPEWSP